MRQFVMVPDALAIADDRVVAIVQVKPTGEVVVRDLATDAVLTVQASGLRPLAAPKRRAPTRAICAACAAWVCTITRARSRT